MDFKDTEEQIDIFNHIKDFKYNLLVEARAGSGKCLGINTPILMYDGSIKMVQHIKIGDMLMGDDSTPRKVLNTNKDIGKLYKIIPQKGDSWVCNDVHILTLHNEKTKKIIDIQLNEIDVPKYPNGNNRYYRLQRTSVEYNKQPLNIDPYLLGVWIGDGTKRNGDTRFSINNNDLELIDYLMNCNYHNITPKKTLTERGYTSISLTTQNFSNSKNLLKDEFRKCINPDGTISIPKEYLINNKENRLNLLAGLIDTDGHVNKNRIEIITKWDNLKNDILYLCRSLGFAAYASSKKGIIKKLNFEGNYWRISISGNLNIIPNKLKRKKCTERKQIKSVLRTGFKTEYIGDGNYYGFTLDGNGRFLLGDFTITHNTTTAVKAVGLLPETSNITFLAFNKHIQTELKTKLPKHVRCYTSHGLGFQALKRKYGKDIEFDEFKVQKIIQRKAKAWDLNEFESQDDIDDYFKMLLKFVNLCRATLVLKKKYLPYIAEKYDLRFITDHDEKRIMSILEEIVKDRKSFDYSDMVFLPAIDKKIWFFPQDYVFVDEAQDLNRAQQEIIKRILRKDDQGNIIGKLCAIGDPMQSIYSFAGSDTRSFEWFKKFPNTKILPLTVSFRCAKNIIAEAQKIVPDIKALPNAPNGIVREDGDVLNEARDGDFVLCRTTLPLVRLFLEFLSQHKKAMIKGSDIGLSLLDMIKNYKDIKHMKNSLRKELRDFANGLRAKGIINYQEHSGYVALEDKAMVLVYLASICTNMRDLRSKIKQIFSDELEGIVLSTVHKAKGLEAERVFIIRPDLLPMKVPQAWQAVQEKNLKYVAVTRAKKELIFDFNFNDEEDE
ncbi:MAG: UvrD-helicase domain-containing protein [bacterium]